MYEIRAEPTYRVAASPPPKRGMWMIAGIAGGIQPWWHHVGAYQEDRRVYDTAEPVMKWHKANEAYLVDRRPVATRRIRSGRSATPISSAATMPATWSTLPTTASCRR